MCEERSLRPFNPPLSWESIPAWLCSGAEQPRGTLAEHWGGRQGHGAPARAARGAQSCLRSPESSALCSPSRGPNAPEEPQGLGMGSNPGINAPGPLLQCQQPLLLPRRSTRRVEISLRGKPRDGWDRRGLPRAAGTKGSCLAAARLLPARRGGPPECRQQKQKCGEVNRVHARGTSCCCLGPSIHLSEGYHFGDAFNKGARTVSGCQSLRETCRQPLPRAGVFQALTSFCASKMKENRTCFVLSAACRSQRDTYAALKKEWTCCTGREGKSCQGEPGMEPRSSPPARGSGCARRKLLGNFLLGREKVHFYCLFWGGCLCEISAGRLGLVFGEETRTCSRERCPGLQQVPCPERLWLWCSWWC